MRGRRIRELAPLEEHWFEIYTTSSGRGIGARANRAEDSTVGMTFMRFVWRGGKKNQIAILFI